MKKASTHQQQILNPYFSETFCFECDSRIDTKDLDICIKDKDHTSNCQFICPKCQKASITQAVACGLRKEPYHCKIPNIPGALSEEQIIPTIQKFIGKYLTTYTICETILGNVAAMHNNKVQQQINDDGAKTPAMQHLLNSLQKADFINPQIQKIYLASIHRINHQIIFRDTLAHGRFIHFFDKNLKDTTPRQISVQPDKQRNTNILPYEPIGYFGYIKDNKPFPLNEQEITQKINQIHALKNLIKAFYTLHQTSIHTGLIICNAKNCPCITESKKWLQIQQKEAYLQSIGLGDPDGRPPFHITPSGLWLIRPAQSQYNKENN